MTKVYLHGTDYRIDIVENGFHPTSDSELLGKFIKPNQFDTVLDIGCNDGTLLLYASCFHPAGLTGIEINADAVIIARKNMLCNGVHASIVEGDVKKLSGKYTYIVCNPPYFTNTNACLKKKSFSSKIARHDDLLTLEDLFLSVSRLLEENGHFALIQRKEKEETILRLAKYYGLSVTRYRYARPRKEKPVKTILYEFKSGEVSFPIEEKDTYMDQRETFYR